MSAGVGRIADVSRHSGGRVVFVATYNGAMQSSRPTSVPLEHFPDMLYPAPPTKNRDSVGSNSFTHTPRKPRSAIVSKVRAEARAALELATRLTFQAPHKKIKLLHPSFRRPLAYQSRARSRPSSASCTPGKEGRRLSRRPRVVCPRARIVIASYLR